MFLPALILSDVNKFAQFNGEIIFKYEQNGDRQKTRWMGGSRKTKVTVAKKHLLRHGRLELTLDVNSYSYSRLILITMFLHVVCFQCFVELPYFK